MSITEYRDAVRKRMAEHQQEISLLNARLLTDLSEMTQAFVGNADLVDREYEAVEYQAKANVKF